MASFPRSATKTGKAGRGATPVETTPLVIRARPRLAAAVDAEVRARSTRAFARWARLIERITIRFDDINGPRGGDDARCAIQVELGGLAPVHVEHVAASAGAAHARAQAAAVRAVRRLLDRRDRSAGRASAPDARRFRPEPAPSLIGRREGRSAMAQAMVLARPEKQVRDLWTDTAQPGVSETDRVAGGGHTARRNTKKRRSGMTAALEDSLTTPSRKSTRRSTNRGKTSQGKERTAVAKSLTPSARRSRSRTR